MYIDGRPKEIRNIAGFINSMCLESTNKWPNCIFEVREGSHVFVCAIKSISLGEELLIDYNLNHIDINKDSIMGLVITIYILIDTILLLRVSIYTIIEIRSSSIVINYAYSSN